MAYEEGSADGALGYVCSRKAKVSISIHTNCRSHTRLLKAGWKLVRSLEVGIHVDDGDSSLASRVTVDLSFSLGWGQ